MRAALAVPVVAAVLLAGCGRGRERPYPGRDEPGPAATPASSLPEACMIRFEQSKGAGFSKEGWQLEVLQIGSDVRVRGEVQAAGSYVPVFRTMDQTEFAQLWDWVSKFPLDGFRVVEDTTVAPEGWRKRLQFDAVLGPDKRELSENEWVRPPTNAPWLQSIEDRFHLMALDLAGKTLKEEKAVAPVPDSTGVVRKTLEALGDLPSTSPPDSDTALLPR